MSYRPSDNTHSIDVWLILIAWVMLIVISGYGIHRLSAPKPLLFAERWPDGPTLFRWEVNSMFWRVTRPRSMSERCQYNYRTQEYCT